MKATETELYDGGLGGNEFRNYFAKFVLSTLTLHKSNAQTKIQWVKNFHYVTVARKPLFYFQSQKLDILIGHAVQ